MKQPRDQSASYSVYHGPLGPIYIAIRGEALTGMSFLPPLWLLRGKFPPSVPHLSPPPEALAQELEAYFGGSAEGGFSFPIALTTGTVFEREVWLLLRDIPYGHTRTYKWVAEQVGRPRAVRAVGQALKKNPLPIALPCHRVINSDCSLGGFAAGQHFKRRLLELEGAPCLMQPKTGRP